jgi:hypothetical protein
VFVFQVSTAGQHGLVNDPEATAEGFLTSARARIKKKVRWHFFLHLKKKHKKTIFRDAPLFYSKAMQPR